MFKLKKERINTKKKIGSGASGNVYPYQKDAEDSKWVVKRIHADDTDQLLSFLPEIVLGFSCDHPCIVPLKGYNIEKIGQDDYYIYLKFPRMKETLKEKFDAQKKVNRPFSEEELVKYFYSMVCAVDYLHKKKIYHRDIKPGNVLLDESGNAMLSDVGVAKHVGDEEIYQPLTGQGGTVDYTAPELLKDKFKLTKENLIAGDVWSLGLVLLELCILKNRLLSPYAAREKIEEVQNNLHDQLKDIYSKTLVKLIFSLLKFEPNERIKIGDLKEKLEAEYCSQLNHGFHPESRRWIYKVENINAQPEKDSKVDQDMAQEGLKAFVVSHESLMQENLRLQNELKEYRSFTKKLQSETFPEHDMSDQGGLEKVLTDYQENGKKLKESEKAIRKQSSAKPKESPDLEEKKEFQDSIPRHQTTVSAGTIPNTNQLQNQQISVSQSLDANIKLLGPEGSGKTGIINRLAHTFLEKTDPKIKKIGLDFFTVTEKRNGKTLKLRFWDPERDSMNPYDDLLGLYMKGGSVVIIVYDITNRRSFEEVPKWIKIKKGYLPDVILFIVGTKLDLENEREVPKEEAEALAKEHGGKSLEVSAKEDRNFDELREQIASAILENYNPVSSRTSTVQVTKQKKSSFWDFFG